MSTYQCSGYTAAGERCRNISGRLWNGLFPLCNTHQQRLAAYIRQSKQSAVAKHEAKLHEFRDRMRAEREAQDTWVYFVRVDDLIKIGISRNPKARLSGIRTGICRTPVGMDTSKAKILATMLGGRPKELELHERFAHLRDVGEWFHAKPELTDFVREVANQ